MSFEEIAKIAALKDANYRFRGTDVKITSYGTPKNPQVTDNLASRMVDLVLKSGTQTANALAAVEAIKPENLNPAAMEKIKAMQVELAVTQKFPVGNGNSGSGLTGVGVGKQENYGKWSYFGV